MNGPVRGVNPEPSGGWPWCLTDYEIAYIAEYRVRPVREGSWAGNPEQEALLKEEAAGALNQASARRRPSRAGMPALVFVPIAGLLVLLTMGMVLATFWVRGQIADLDSRLGVISESVDSSNGQIDWVGAKIKGEFIVP